MQNSIFEYFFGSDTKFRNQQVFPVFTITLNTRACTDRLDNDVLR